MGDGNNVGAKDLSELLPIPLDGANALDGQVMAHAHLNRVGNRPHGLLFEGGRLSIPALRLTERPVEGRRGAPPALLAAHAGGDRLAVSKAKARTMTTGAGHSAIEGQAGVIIELLPERDLLRGQRIICGNKDREAFEPPWDVQFILLLDRLRLRAGGQQ